MKEGFEVMKYILQKEDFNWEKNYKISITLISHMLRFFMFTISLERPELQIHAIQFYESLLII